MNWLVFDIELCSSGDTRSVLLFFFFKREFPILPIPRFTPLDFCQGEF
jgi:hypothetical protein